GAASGPSAAVAGERVVGIRHGFKVAFTPKSRTNGPSRSESLTKRRPRVDRVTLRGPAVRSVCPFEASQSLLPVGETLPARRVFRLPRGDLSLTLEGPDEQGQRTVAIAEVDGDLLGRGGGVVGLDLGHLGQVM